MQISFQDVKNSSNVIDIRTSLAYNKHNLGFKNVPRLMLLSDPSKYLNKNEEYYLLCDTGLVSLSCSNILNALGYRCYSIKGGIDNLNEA